MEESINGQTTLNIQSIKKLKPADSIKTKKTMHQKKHLLALFIGLFLLFSCETEKIDLTKHETEDTISSDSPLFNLISMITTQDSEQLLPIACVDFVYPITMLVYDENRNPVETITVGGDTAFSNLLGSLPENNTISISYPITTSFSDGTLTTINTNTELKLALDSCAQDEIIGLCDGIFSDDENCGWEVPYLEGYSNTYASGYFRANPDHTITFIYNNEEYLGTWNFLYLNDVLHLNINLAGNSAVSTFWNQNNKVIVGEFTMEFAAPSTHPLILKKKCEDNETTYNIGDNGPAGGIVFYDKGSYSNGWRYIEAATQDLNASQWGCPGLLVPNTSNTTIGYGYLNATSSLNFHNSLNNFYTNPSGYSSNSNGTVVTKEPLNLVLGGNDDWFLPTSEELNTMYSNLHLQSLGNFSSGKYWSSTQSDADNAKVVDFSDGNTLDNPKSDLTVKARAIRYF